VDGDVDDDAASASDPVDEVEFAGSPLAEKRGVKRKGESNSSSS